MLLRCLRAQTHLPRPWSWVCPLPTCTKYTCSSTVRDLRFFPRLDPGTSPSRFCSAVLDPCGLLGLLYTPATWVWPPSCPSRCDLCSRVYCRGRQSDCHVRSVRSRAAPPQSQLFILWLLLVSSPSVRREQEGQRVGSCAVPWPGNLSHLAPPSWSVISPSPHFS